MLRALVRRLVGSRLARDSGWALAAELVRIGLQIATFLVITHLFDADAYGVYVGTIALLAFVIPFANFGAPYLLLQRIAGRGIAPDDALGRATATVLLGGTAATVLLALLRPWVLPQAGLGVLVTLALTELVLSAVHELTVFSSQATRKLHLSVPLRLVVGVSRLAGLLVLWAMVEQPSLLDLTVANLVAAAASTVIAWALLLRHGIGSRRMHRPRREDLRDGLPYSIGFGADRLRESADGLLLLRLDKPTDSGIWGAAGRLIDLTVVPLRSLIHASNARIFERGSTSVAEGRREAMVVARVAMAYAIPAAAVMALVGPLLVDVLPSSYQDAGDAVRLLSLWPLSVALEAFAGTALTAVGHHRVRVVTSIVGAALNVGLDLLLIPDHGWRGAVIATLVAGFASSAVMWSALTVVARHAPHRAGQTEDPRSRTARS